MNQNSTPLNNDELEANVQRLKFLNATQKFYRMATSSSTKSNGSSNDISSEDDANRRNLSTARTWEEIIEQVRTKEPERIKKSSYHNHSVANIRQAVQVLYKKLETTNRQLLESQKNKEYLTLKIRELEDRLKASGIRLPNEFPETAEDYTANTMERLRDLAAECARREKLVQELEEQERFLRANLHGGTDPAAVFPTVARNHQK